MIEPNTIPIHTLPLRHERHVVLARQRTRDIAATLGFDHQDQIRLATATSELARNAFRYATGATVEFAVQEPALDSKSQLFLISVNDAGPGIPNLSTILDGNYISTTGLGKGIIGTRRLMEHFEIATSSSGTTVRTGKHLPCQATPLNAERIQQITKQLALSSPADPFEEIDRQNQELLKTLAELREKQEKLAELNRELEDTNRGVVALYAELDQRAIDLRNASDMKTSFLSNLSHEFRTPLNSITSLTRLLLNHTDGSLEPEQERQINYIQRSASELSELVNDLLDLAKVEAGKVDVKPRAFDVNDLFGALRGMLRPLLIGNSLDLIFDVDPQLSSIYTDEGKVSQILRNLISNAIKFTPRGQVHIHAIPEPEDSPNRKIFFKVSDTGIGISPEDQKRIFDQFAQIDSEIQSRVKGTGLGLPLSRRLAELLGGTLEVESQLGSGSTFTVALPMYFGGASLPAARHASTGQTQGPSILFIEDNPETTFVIESSLKGTGYHLIFAPNLIEARAVLHRDSPSLIVLDRIIQDQDALPFIPEIKSKGFQGPVVVVSVVDDPDAALQAGADRFLPKPVAPFTLVNTVREFLEGQSAKTVLLSDDDEITRYLLGEAMAAFGFRVLEARNGREAIRMVQSYNPDVLFLDIAMPDLNGFEVLREINSSPSAKQTSIIIHSSKTLSESEQALLADAGAVIYPKEPIGDQESHQKLRQVLISAGLPL